VSILRYNFAFGNKNQRLAADQTGESILAEIFDESVLSRRGRRVGLEENRLGFGLFMAVTEFVLGCTLDVDSSVLKRR
jgi:hypothetical protein